LINGKRRKNEIQEKLRNYGIDLQGKIGKIYLVSVLNVDSSSFEHDSEDEVWQQHNTDGFRLIDDEELLNFAIFNISEEIIKKYELGLIFICNEYIVIIAASNEDNGQTLTDKALIALEEIRMYIEKFLRVTITAGVGNICREISDVNISYKNAIAALDYRIVLGNNKTICIGDVEPKHSEESVFDDLKAHTLICALKVGTPSEIKMVLEVIFEEFINFKASYKDYQIYLLEILTTILKVAKDMAIDTDNVFGPNYNLFTEMYRFKEIQDVKDWFICVCIKITGYISKNRQNSCQSLVKEAKDYIRNNYHNSEITIDMVCKHLHISPTYFSTIFKRETKITFINYLTHIRMEAAKELLRTTNLKTAEIAERVGYSEQNYFSFCFKKSLNISPSEFRNSI